MPYDVELPNGVTLTDIPDDVSHSEVRKMVLQKFPDIAAKEKRTWGETAEDLAASLGSGTGQLAQFPAQVEQLLTGSRPVGEYKAPKSLSEAGQQALSPVQTLGQMGTSLEKFSTAQKSPILQAKEELRGQKIQEANGLYDEFKTSIGQTIKDPALLSSFFVEQLPNLIGSGGFGSLAKGGAKLALRGATEEALAKIGVSGVVAGNAVMQGADIGNDTYNTAYQQLKDKMPDEQAHTLALSQGRKAAIEAAGVSLLATKLPGGKTIETALAGRGLSGAGGFLHGAFGEALSEAAEEGGGALAKNYNLKQVLPETSLTKGVGSAAGLGALGGALLGAPAGMINAGAEARHNPNISPVPVGTPGGVSNPTVPGPTPTVPAPTVPAPTVPAPAPTAPTPTVPAPAPGQPQVAGPFTPLKQTPEGEIERDLFGAVPGKKAAPPGAEFGPPRPETTPTGTQTELPFPGQGELFKGPEPTQPEQTPTPQVAPPAPIDIHQIVRGVVTAAKADPTASKLLKGNNTSTAKIVSTRVEDLMKSNPELDHVQALEQLFQQDQTGKYPKGTKALSEPQRELVNATYQSLTGLSVEDGIKNRAYMQAPTGELFPGEPNAGNPVTQPGETPPNVGVPNEPGSPETPGGTGTGEPSGVAPGETPPTGTPGGETPQSTPLTPEEAWNVHRDPNHPAFGELHPEEQAAWTKAVNAGRPNANNYAQVMQAHLTRTGQANINTKDIIDAYGKEMSQDIEDQIAGKSFNEVLKLLSTTGPKANQEIAKAIQARVKELMGHGYKFVFELAATRADVKRIGGYSSSGVLGRLDPYTNHKTMHLSVAGKASGQSFGGQLKTVTHEMLHAVTTALIDYGARNPGSHAGIIVKELEAINRKVKSTLNKKVKDGVKLTPSEYKVLYGTNALGSRYAGRIVHKADEMISHGLTSHFMIEVLESIPYKKGKTLLNKFVETIRDLIGLSPKADTALSRVLDLSDQLLKTPAGVVASGIRKRATPGFESSTTGTVPAPGQPYTLKRLTKLQPTSTPTQRIAGTVKNINKTINDNEFWTSMRVGWIDKFAGISKRLSSLPVFSNGKLRADMLLRSANQVINLIKNGLQTGIPVINKDGTIVIHTDGKSLAVSQGIADKIDSNPIIKGSGFTGRGYIGEIARILRGEQIQKLDVQRRAKAASMMLVAKQKMAEARMMRNMGAPLTEIIKRVNEAKAIRNQYREDLNINRERQVTDSHIQWAKEQLQAVPEVQKVLDIWKHNNDSLINLWEHSGLLSADQAAYYRSMSFYVPLYASRVDLASEKQEGYAGKATGTKTVKELPLLEGSDLERNIWENMDKHYASMIAAAYQNHTRKIAVEQLESLGAARVTKDYDPDVNNLRYKDPSHPLANNKGYVSVILDNPNDLAAFQIMQHELNPIMKVFSASTKLLRTTALINPMYWIKQLIRDPLEANLIGNSGIVTPFHSIAEYARIISNNSPEARELARRGIIGQVDSTIDLHTFLKQAGTEKVSPTVLDNMLHKVMQVHEAADAATRVSVFKKSKAEGLKRGMSEEEANDYGAFRAREANNFSVQGNSKLLHTLRHWIPFFSASLTSIDSVYKAATGYGLNPEEKAELQKKFYSRAALMAVLSTLYALSLQDDEEYKKLPDNVKDTNWLIPNPWEEKSFIKVPVPFEVGFLFKSLPEATVRYISGTSTGKEMIGSLVDGLQRNLPGDGILIPQAVKPGLEAVTNYSFFTHRSIEGLNDQGLPVANRDAGTSETAKALSKTGLDNAGLSPKMIDHLWQGYTAQLGSFAFGVSDALISNADDKVGPAQNLSSQTFFKSFMTNPNTSKAASDFYEIMHTAQETTNLFNRFKSEGQIESAKELVSDEDKRKLIAITPVLRTIQNQMNQLRKQVNYYKENEAGLTPEERQEKINQAMQKYDMVARKGYEVMDRAGLPR